MQNLKWEARLYIGCTLGIGASLYIWHFLHLGVSHPVLLTIISIFAAITHILKVEGATARSSYQISWIAYGASFVLLSPSEMMLVLLVTHAAEWFWHRQVWYIVLFNLCAFVIVASTATLIRQWINADNPPFAAISAVGFLATAAIFTILNHLLIGIVIWLARGENLVRSGIFNILSLMIDFVSFGMGIASGLIWLVNPYAVIFILSPLYLIYTTLQVPALQEQTRTEPKTGLYNARYFSEALAAELERADRFDRPLTVIMADVDLLRNINNTYGHLAGDTVLIGIANILRACARDFDVVARFGGEEYAILMPETTLHEALPLIEAIRETIATTQFEVSTSVTPLAATMSFGAAEREHFGQSAEEIVHNADLAVYHSKSTTRNRLCYSTQGEIFDFGSDHTKSYLAEDRSAVEVDPSLAQTVATLREKPLRRKLEHIQFSGPKTAYNIGNAIDKLLSQLQPMKWLIAYITALALIAISFYLWSFWQESVPDWQGIIIFTVLALLTELLAIEVYARNTSVSTAVAPLVAGACLFGANGALALSLVLAAASLIKHRSPFSRFVFNASNHLLAALVCVTFLRLSGLLITDTPTLASALAVITATGLNYLITTLLTAGVIYLSSGQTARSVWSERFYWLWPYYVALGLVAYALVLAYLSSGLIGVLVFLIPLLMLRISQNQYLSRTESMVVQLRTANAELIERSNEIAAMNEGLILALSHASDLRDPYVHGHALHVARYSVLIAEELGLSVERIQAIRQAALLHDIGKIGIPETILFKPTKLTYEEYQLMKHHAALGAALVQEIESLHHLAPFIRHHHEHWNGRGYPSSLAGEAIPLESRIISVADAVEAMASDRPYRQACDAKNILSELHSHSGKQFDPLVVDAFSKVITRQGEALIVNSASNILRHIETGESLNYPKMGNSEGNHGTTQTKSERIFLSELDCMNTALQRAIAAHRRMEANAQEGKELAETLLRVASIINTTLEQDRVLALILEQLANVVNYDNASIMLLDGDILNAVARRSIHVPESQFLSVRIDKLMHVQEVLEHKRAVVISDTHNDPRWMRRQGSENIRCWLGVPLIVQNHIIGLLNLSNGTAGYYTERHVQVTTAFAAHAAIALENARLFTQAQQELEERERAESELQKERALLAQRVEERTAELRFANEKLTSALRTKDEFLATVSHELRTPLNAILLLTESMQNGVYGVLGERQSGVLDNVQQSARHLLALINDILDMSKIESGMFELDMGAVSVPIICRDSLQLVQEAANVRHITLRQELDDTVKMIQGDERRLKQILVNLLSNAVKFTPEGGEVGLKVVRDHAHQLAHFTVWDTGIGIAKEDMAKLFQPFVQLDSKLSRQYEGTGLGLALVHRLVQLHGGAVNLESEVGQGSRFTVSLPWHEDSGVQNGIDFLSLTEHASGEMDDNVHMSDAEWLASIGLESFEDIESYVAEDTSSLHTAPLLLLVDDNEIGMEAMLDYLTAHNYRVIVARNGTEAIAQTAQHRPDLILMDIQMPDMDGLEATKRIRANAEFAATPIIALTALAMPGDRERCLRAGANEYLSKPVSMKHLIQVIESQLNEIVLNQA
ncbi:MAG: diguanylate cyclase [Caldilineaceae bacterium]